MNLQSALIPLLSADESRLVLALDLANRIIDHSSDAILISTAEPLDQPGPLIVFANRTFKARTGYSEEDLIGKTPRILQGPKTDQHTLRRIRTALEAWEPIREEVLNYKKMAKSFGKN